MKKNLFAVVILLIAGEASAQLRVDSLGNTFMGSHYILPSVLNVTTTSISAPRSYSNTLYLQKDGTPTAETGTHSALYALSRGYKVSKMYGVRAITYYNSSNSSQHGYRIGVLGVASGGLDGQNYGVIGACPIYDGAGIFGTTSGSITSATMLTLDQRYAGYFKGLTKVQGDFVVTGNISGTLLTPSSGSSSASVSKSQEDSESDVSNLLKGLRATSFFYDTPNPLPESVPEDETGEIETTNRIPDSVVQSQQSSLMEQQIISKQHYSLSAAELEQIFPDLVYENEDGSKSINYVEMVPLLVQAIGELKSEINELRGNGSARKVAAKATGIGVADESMLVLALGQNKPNPFGTSTEIEVNVPESVQSAFVYVYDLQGKKVQQVNITARGKQTVQLNATDLSDGMYLYSLIADGKVIETRRMIVE